MADAAMPTAQKRRHVHSSSFYMRMRHSGLQSGRRCCCLFVASEAVFCARPDFLLGAFFWRKAADDFGRHAADDSVGFHIFGNHGACADHCAVTD